MDMEHLTLTWDSPQALLAELRGLGRNTASARQPGLRGRQWHQTLMSELTRRLAGPDGRLHLRFEILYGHAFRPVARARMQTETAISLEAMREMTRQRNPGRTD
jgi:malonyl-CoA O-methyltransferase